MIPASLKNDTTYQTILGTLDGVIGGLTETVMDYKQRMVEASVCWRFKESRARVRPRICPPEFAWNGEQFCFPTNVTALLDTGIDSLDAAAMGKTEGSTSGKGIPTGAVPAVCDESTEYAEKHGHWCYKPCRSGFEPTDEKCRVACQGAFFVEGGPLMCGHNQIAITQAIMQMVIEMISTLISLATQIQTMVEHGVSAEPLTGTIQTLINLGKPFAFDRCPVVEG